MNLHNDSFSDEKLEPRNSHDGVKKIYRTATELVRRVDGVCKHATTCDDLFNIEAKVLRIKLRELCERLMFYDPVGYGKKVEEMLWRKVYYDVIAQAKQLKKDEDKSALAALSDHINAGIGAYHHLLARLQAEYYITDGVSDFLITSSKNDKKISPKKKEWAQNAFHRGLVCLGDLARYRNELFANCRPDLSERFYSQAACFMPALGMPHNQQGTLSSGKNYGVNATFHYMRCLVSEQKFEGSRGNLERIFEKVDRLLSVCNATVEKNADLIKRCLLKFLKLCEYCCMDDIANSSVQLELLCQDILEDFYACLHFNRIDNKKDDDLEFLDDHLVFKLVAMSLMGTYLLMEKGSKNQSAAIAFSLALFSHVLQLTIIRCEQILGVNVQNLEDNCHINGSPHANNKKNKLKQMRLRKRKNPVHDDSDLSEAEDNSDENSDEQTSDLSELDENESSTESEDGADTDHSSSKLTNGDSRHDGIPGKRSKGKVNKSSSGLQIQCMVRNEGLFMAIKICCDWLKSHSEIFNICGQGCQLLWSRMATLLNMFVPVFSCDAKDGIVQDNILTVLELCKKGMTWKQTITLPEDVLLSGFPLLRDAHTDLPFNQLPHLWLSSIEMYVLRVSCIHQFGLSIAEANVADFTYDVKLGIFSKNNELWAAVDQQKNEKQKKKMMENMAQLWLKAEVNELESSVRSANQPRLSPYLVVMTPVLIDRLPLLRQLVASKRFIVVIPTVVISHLDWMKKESLQARDVIRWLETEFHRGNRYLRAQKPREQSSLSPMKYPRRKDREAWNLFQILECCKHLSEQGVSPSSGLVTLLTGSADEGSSLNIRALAESTGINTECIEAFLQKWTSTKNG